jgi:hypothetical protein
LNNLADEVFFLYPWGSLLKGVLGVEREVLVSLRRICKKNGTLRMIISLDPEQDRTELQRLAINLLPADQLIAKYSDAGFELVEDVWAPIETTGSRRIRQNKNRILFDLTFRAQ